MNKISKVGRLRICQLWKFEWSKEESYQWGLNTGTDNGTHGLVLGNQGLRVQFEIAASVASVTSVALEIGPEVTLNQRFRGQFEIAASNGRRGRLGGRGLSGLGGLEDWI